MAKTKKNKYMIFAVGFVIILLASILVYNLPFNTVEKEKSEELETAIPKIQLLTKTYAQMEQEGLLEQMEVIDPRIAPYENQGVIFEILRIRHRGLLDKLLTPGGSWRTKPEFYFITNIDGMEHVSKDVQQQQTAKEILFNTWDSIFQENKIMRTAEQEQDTSEITLTIVEREKIGLLGRRTRDVEKDSFTVTYCYRTGRWTGDNNFGEKEGYGYYLGETFEIWFNIYQPDFDNDYIPYWTEVNILGTDPTKADSKLDKDEDGIPTYWEWKWGYNPFTWDDHFTLDPDMDSLTNIWEYRLEKYFADPFIENIYLEVDFMERTGLIFDPPTIFYEETKQALIERYAQHNIKVFFDNGWPNTPQNGGGTIVPYIEMMSQDSGMILQYYNNYFPDERKGGFIYLLLGYLISGGFQHPAKGNVYDTIYIWDIPFGSLTPIETMKAWIGLGRLPTPRGARIGQAGILLHELGHFGGLVSEYFEGVDKAIPNSGAAAFDILKPKEYKETWGKYRSVMNYAYALSQLDYSNGQNGPPYDFNDWANLHFGGWQGVSPFLEEAYCLVYGEEWEHKIEHLIQKDLNEIETPPITGYIYDNNLTETFEKQVSSWSPNTRWNVEWEVHRLIDKKQYPDYRDIKILVSPKDIRSKYHIVWSLFMEGDFDTEGNILFSNGIPINKLTLQ